MTQHFLISVTLDDAALDSRLRLAAYLRFIHLKFSRRLLDKALNFLQHNQASLDVFCEGTNLDDVREIVRLLNAGAKAVFVDAGVLEACRDDAAVQDLVHTGRIIPTFGQPTTSGALGCTGQNNDIIDKAFSCVKLSYAAWSSSSSRQTNGRPQIFVDLSDMAQNIAEGLSRDYVAIVPAARLSIRKSADPDLTSLSELIAFFLHSDRADGLFPTIVADELGVSLGLVYSSLESVTVALETGQGVYYSRSRQRLWKKGEESGNLQELQSISLDCDADALQFRVRQEGDGFCHLGSTTCFGDYDGLNKLHRTLLARKQSAPPGSYTSRLFNDSKLLQAKIMEEANELCEAKTAAEVASEAADLFYFALTKCVAAGVDIAAIAHDLDNKSLKVTRRKGDAKARWVKASKDAESSNPESVSNRSPYEVNGGASPRNVQGKTQTNESTMNGIKNDSSMRRIQTSTESQETIAEALQRPSQRSTDEIMGIVTPIIADVRKNGDDAVLRYTHKFEGAVSLKSPVIKGPFSSSLANISEETRQAIDVSYANIERFHAAQKETTTLQVETMPGVLCSRFSRPIESVGLYVPGGTAVLPSTALMLGVPAKVAGCKKIVIATPPRRDGSVSPEIVYIAQKIGAESILVAGGAQAVAALAYGTQSITKVDKILGPGNQFVTAAKMLVSNDTTAAVSIDMPAGPSEVLVIADESCEPAFVAADLLSQAEHGADSQVVLIAIDLTLAQLAAIEQELQRQTDELPRSQIAKKAIAHSVTLLVDDVNEAIHYSNIYAPEHLILQVKNAQEVVAQIENAGSIFIGPWTPESVGDYSAGVNHSLPTYGYAKQYSGVNLASFTKNITSSELTEDGLRNISSTVTTLAHVEGLEAHRRAVTIRLQHLANAATKN